MKCPEEVQLSGEDGEALRQRLAGDTLTATDRRVLDLVLQWYFWLLFALQEATFSLKRLRVLLFGAKPNTRTTTPLPGAASNAGHGPGGMGSAPAQGVPDATEATDCGATAISWQATPRPWAARRRDLPWRRHVDCRHETLAVGERCPVCGRGRLYRVAPGVEIRLDGHALLSAVRYVLEKFRCSACGQVFTAAVPAEAGAEKYSAGHGRSWCWGATTWGCPSTDWKGIKRWSGCRWRMRPSGIRSSAWPIVRIRCLNSSRSWRRKER